MYISSRKKSIGYPFKSMNRTQVSANSSGHRTASSIQALEIRFSALVTEPRFQRSFIFE